MATALTQAYLDKLEKAYASGVLEVSYNGETVRYDSGSELLKRIQYVKEALASTADKRPPSTYASFERC